MFRSLTIYQLTQAIDAIHRKLEPGLAGRPFKACPEKQAASRGFVKPLGDDSEVIVYESTGAVLFCLRTDEKVVPPAALRLLVDERVKALAQDSDGEPSKTDVRLIKEEVEESLLPSTIPTPRWTFAYLDRFLGLLFVGATDDAADAFMEELGKAIDGRPFALLGLKDRDPSDIYTEWLSDPKRLCDAFELGNACSLKHPKEGGTAVINISHEDLESEDLHALLDAGKQCCRIALQHEAMSFAITAKLGLRSMTLGQGFQEELAEQEDPTQRSASEFALYVRAVREVLKDLEPLLGGWPQQELLDLEDTEAAA
jgi:recombination associated protein RdgC